MVAWYSRKKTIKGHSHRHRRVTRDDKRQLRQILRHVSDLEASHNDRLEAVEKTLNNQRKINTHTMAEAYDFQVPAVQKCGLDNVEKTAAELYHMKAWLKESAAKSATPLTIWQNFVDQPDVAILPQIDKINGRSVEIGTKKRLLESIKSPDLTAISKIGTGLELVLRRSAVLWAGREKPDVNLLTPLTT